MSLAFRIGLRKIPNHKVFVANSSHPRHRVKERIIMEGLIPYICAICKIEPMWQSKTLTLVLDHINGVNNDNRLKNLRFLCPNCNSQTKTFSLGHRRMKKLKR
jgi:5-methylcytosine-specific restriction endonuclease McrA